MRTLLPSFVARFTRRLRFPYLFLLTTVLFVADLLIPDMIPIADEILFGLGMTVLARWKKRKTDNMGAALKGGK